MLVRGSSESWLRSASLPKLSPVFLCPSLYRTHSQVSLGSQNLGSLFNFLLFVPCQNFIYEERGWRGNGLTTIFSDAAPSFPKSPHVDSAMPWAWLLSMGGGLGMGVGEGEMTRTRPNSKQGVSRGPLFELPFPVSTPGFHSLLVLS